MLLRYAYIKYFKNSNSILFIRCYQKAGLLQKPNDITKCLNTPNLVRKVIKSFESSDIFIW